MKNKYIVFFKGSIVFLLILLVVVGFSFGISFSSFVYSSNDHRAVEMYVSSLNYKLFINDSETNTYLLKPGYNLLNIEIESLNRVDTYYKLVSEYETNIYYYDCTSDEVISKNETISKKILIFNSSEDSENINFKIESGYITNTIEDVKVSNGYYEIKDSINTGGIITYKDNNYRLINIDENGIELLGDVIDNKITLNGCEGFNNASNTINETLSSQFSDENIIEVRSVTKEDIFKFVGSDVIKYSLLPLEVIEEGFYIPSSLIKKDYEEEYSISKLAYFPRIEINNDMFKNSNYYEMFSSNKEYFINSTYKEKDEEVVNYGIFTVSNDIDKGKLYDWKNESYSVKSNIRPVIVLSNKLNIKDID